MDYVGAGNSVYPQNYVAQNANFGAFGSNKILQRFGFFPQILFLVISIQWNDCLSVSRELYLSSPELGCTLESLGSYCLKAICIRAWALWFHNRFPQVVSMYSQGGEASRWQNKCVSCTGQYWQILRFKLALMIISVGVCEGMWVQGK